MDVAFTRMPGENYRLGFGSLLSCSCDVIRALLPLYRGKGRGRLLYLSLHFHHQNDSCIMMGSDESHLNVSLGYNLCQVQL